MPIQLNPVDPAGKFKPNSTVLFAVCGLCPRMCLAVKKKKPFFSIAQLLSRRNYFEVFIDEMRNTLEKENMSTAVFETPLFSSIMCLWPEATRKRLRQRIPGFDAVAVLGCRSAIATVEGVLGSSHAEIVPLLEEQGIANFKTRFRFPFSLEVTE